MNAHSGAEITIKGHESLGRLEIIRCNTKTVTGKQLDGPQVIRVPWSLIVIEDAA